MKKWIRVTLIVAACVLAVGLLTGGMGLYMFWATADRYTPENPVDRDYAVDASALTSAAQSAQARLFSFLKFRFFHHLSTIIAAKSSPSVSAATVQAKYLMSSIA